MMREVESCVINEVAEEITDIYGVKEVYTVAGR